MTSSSVLFVWLSLSNSAAMLSRHGCASSSSRKLVTQRVAFILARRQPRRLVSQPSLTHDQLTYPDFKADLASRDRSGFSDLGLRSSRPSNSIQNSDPKIPSEIPDQDWELRTGPFFHSSGLHTTIFIDIQDALFTYYNKHYPISSPQGSSPLSTKGQGHRYPHPPASRSPAPIPSIASPPTTTQSPYTTHSFSRPTHPLSRSQLHSLPRSM